MPQASCVTDRPKGTLTIPVAPNVYVLLQVPRPMYPAEWEQMMRVLVSMRPGIVEPEPTEQEPA